MLAFTWGDDPRDEIGAESHSVLQPYTPRYEPRHNNATVLFTDNSSRISCTLDAMYSSWTIDHGASVSAFPVARSRFAATTAGNAWGSPQHSHVHISDGDATIPIGTPVLLASSVDAAAAAGARNDVRSTVIAPVSDLQLPLVLGAASESYADYVSEQHDGTFRSLTSHQMSSLYNPPRFPLLEQLNPRQSDVEPRSRVHSSDTTASSELSFPRPFMNRHDGVAGGVYQDTSGLRDESSRSSTPTYTTARSSDVTSVDLADDSLRGVTFNTCQAPRALETESSSVDCRLPSQLSPRIVQTTELSTTGNSSCATISRETSMAYSSRRHAVRAPTVGGSGPAVHAPTVGGLGSFATYGRRKSNSARYETNATVSPCFIDLGAQRLEQSAWPEHPSGADHRKVARLAPELHDGASEAAVPATLPNLEPPAVTPPRRAVSPRMPAVTPRRSGVRACSAEPSSPPPLLAHSAVDTARGIIPAPCGAAFSHDTRIPVSDPPITDMLLLNARLSELAPPSCEENIVPHGELRSHALSSAPDDPLFAPVRLSQLPPLARHSPISPVPVCSVRACSSGGYEPVCPLPLALECLNTCGTETIQNRAEGSAKSMLSAIAVRQPSLVWWTMVATLATDEQEKHRRQQFSQCPDGLILPAAAAGFDDHSQIHQPSRSLPSAFSCSACGLSVASVGDLCAHVRCCILWHDQLISLQNNGPAASRSLPQAGGSDAASCNVICCDK